jgi:hypothetical protein
MARDLLRLTGTVEETRHTLRHLWQATGTSSERRRGALCAFVARCTTHASTNGFCFFESRHSLQQTLSGAAPKLIISALRRPATLPDFEVVVSSPRPDRTQSSRNLPGHLCRGPRPLKVEATKMSCDIHHLTNTIQPRLTSTLHRLR